MANEGPSGGKIFLYILLGVLAVGVGIWLLTNLWWLIVGAVAIGAGYGLYKMGQWSVTGGPTRRQIPR